MDEKKWAEAHHCAAIYSAEWLAADGYDIIFVKADPFPPYDLAARHTQRLIIAAISFEIDGVGIWGRSEEQLSKLLDVAADNEAVACVCHVKMDATNKVRNISLINWQTGLAYDWRNDDKHDVDGVEIGPHELMWNGIGYVVSKTESYGFKVLWINWAYADIPSIIVEEADGKSVAILVRCARRPLKIAPICPISLRSAVSWAGKHNLPLEIVSVGQVSVNDPFDPAFDDESTTSHLVVPLYRGVSVFASIDGPYEVGEYPGHLQEDISSLRCH
ncbi:hypothetical protein [Paramagnetospirillum magneticum]|uniref:hypothetical protein n=1 Tax=Paramagnetospirillum magneticum TaxID=84159 RepID=UPI0011D14B92|nr:hypothetical protein [Paramagnetospirillum magneticum]